MKSIKKFYKDYNNGHGIYELNTHMAYLIQSEMPDNILEFGCGTGKNLNLINSKGRSGIDISSKAIMSGWEKYKDISLIIGDEKLLKSFKDNLFDISFTISVINHIPSPEAENIIQELLRISKKVYLAESNDMWQNYCFPHKYEDMGFTKLNYLWISPKTGAEYNIYVS